MTMSRAYHRSRRAVGTALLSIAFLLPFLRVNRESAFRFDIPSLRLHFFGTAIWMENFFLILVAVLGLTFLALFLTILLGRIWCGWICPQTVLADRTGFMEAARVNGAASRIAAYGAGAAVSALIAASLVGYFVSPYDAVALLRSGGSPASITVVSWAVVSVIIFLDLIALRRRFCATICPYAKMQGVLFDDRTLIVAFDRQREQECMHCDACVRACPVGIDIRGGLQSACIHCAECVDACSIRMERRERPSLIDYVFGSTDGQGTGARTSLYLTGAMTLFSLLLFITLLATGKPFDATVLPGERAEAIARPDGSLTNSFLISLRNTGPSDLGLSLTVEGAHGQIVSSPERILLPRGQEAMKVPLIVTIGGLGSRSERILPLAVTIREDRSGAMLVKKISFILPETQ
jgi:cytochrome c oxidase accessory protein FixG